MEKWGRFVLTITMKISWLIRSKIGLSRARETAYAITVFPPEAVKCVEYFAPTSTISHVFVNVPRVALHVTSYHGLYSHRP